MKIQFKQNIYKERDLIYFMDKNSKILNILLKFYNQILT